MLQVLDFTGEMVITKKMELPDDLFPEYTHSVVGSLGRSANDRPKEPFDIENFHIVPCDVYPKLMAFVLQVSEPVTHIARTACYFDEVFLSAWMGIHGILMYHHVQTMIPNSLICSIKLVLKLGMSQPYVMNRRVLFLLIALKAYIHTIDSPRKR